MKNSSRPLKNSAAMTTTKEKFKIKSKHWIILLSACLLLFVVKMCELDDFSIHKQEKEEIAELEQIKSDSDSLLTEVLQGIKNREEKYNHELDSLNDLAHSGELSKEEVYELEREIRKTEILLDEERTRMDSLVPIMLDSVVYDIELRDTVVYNIILVDTIVLDTIYQVDTVFIDADTLEFNPIIFDGN